MNRRTVALLAIAGLALPVIGGLTASQLSAQVGGSGAGLSEESILGSGRHGDRAERLLETLDLSEDQTTQIRAIREGDREEMQALREAERAEREAMHSLMAGTATDAELRAQHEELQALDREVADLRFENMLAVRNVLTPEQRTEMSTRMEQRRSEHRGLFQGHRENRRQ
jgi:protein CpxP